ncbi:hypothetical protein PVAND_001078 [Polypedilum vanderplanki]|uniref:Odorant receptor n=1 Tax=Polypedilum vanderplanki TaxID=319348 RepID=A0A9J6BLV6_POLVA|nr:hypothetical protein PVAND_001078 [Polypedilum vanderplanki]
MIHFLLIAKNIKKLPEAIETFGLISGHGLYLAKILFFFFWKRTAVMKIIERLDQHFPHSNREQLKFRTTKHCKELKIFGRIILTVYGFTCFHFTYMPLISLFSGQSIELIMPIYFPLDPLQPLLYPIFFIIQSGDILCMALLSIAFDVLFCSLVCVVSMDFEVLAQKLSQIDPESDLNAEKNLQEIVENYNNLIDIANEIEGIFSPLLLLYIFGAIFILCASVFLVFTPIKLYLMVKFIPVLLTAMVQVFCLCFYGEKLQTSSTRVADEAYNCNWYEKNFKFRKMILLTMLRTQQAQKLTGWKFMDVGLPVFYWILQTAHSYYSLLSGLYEA